MEEREGKHRVSQRPAQIVKYKEDRSLTPNTYVLPKKSRRFSHYNGTQCLARPREMKEINGFQGTEDLIKNVHRHFGHLLEMTPSAFHSTVRL